MFHFFVSDLDKEEAFTGGLPEFPSLDNGATTNGDDDGDDLSLGLPSPPSQPQQPIKPKHTPSLKDQPTDRALELVNKIAGDVIAAAVTAAIQERVVLAAQRDSVRSTPPETSRLLELAEDSDSEVEDFELLDQSELEQLEGELGLGGEKVQVKEEDQAQGDKPASSGFFSKLLRRH